MMSLQTRLHSRHCRLGRAGVPHDAPPSAVHGARRSSVARVQQQRDYAVTNDDGVASPPVLTRRLAVLGCLALPLVSPDLAKAAGDVVSAVVAAPSAPTRPAGPDLSITHKVTYERLQLITHNPMQITG